MAILCYNLTALAAYLLGSIPFGYIAAMAKGIDIRSVGSGNIGATNAMRVLGKPAGIVVLVMDVLKGFMAVAVLAPFIYTHLGRLDSACPPVACFDLEGLKLISNHSVLAGIFAVLGHNYTCWLRFKGGKGIATTAGVYLALAPWPLLIAVAVFIFAVMISRYVSIGSIAGAIALPAAVWVMVPHNLFLCIVTTALGALAIYKHKSNIHRLMAGTESRFGQKKELK